MYIFLEDLKPGFQCECPHKRSYKQLIPPLLFHTILHTLPSVLSFSNQGASLSLALWIKIRPRSKPHSYLIPSLSPLCLCHSCTPTPTQSHLHQPIILNSFSTQDLTLASSIQLSPRANIKLIKISPLYSSSEI